MHRIAAVAGREVLAAVVTPGVYVVGALFLLANAGIFQQYCFGQGQVATLQPVFVFSLLMFALVCPALTMRSISEEVRQNTLEALLTCPISEIEIILGKFLAALGLLVAFFIAPTLVFVVPLELYGRPDYGELLCGYFGLVLAGAAFLASGIAASTITANQVVAFLSAFFFWVLLILIAKGLPHIPILPEELRADMTQFLVAFDPDLRMRDFTIGLVDSSHILYFLSMVTVFLIAAVRLLSLRRVW